MVFSHCRRVRPRAPCFERLLDRQMFASDAFPYATGVTFVDVDGNGSIEPFDALLVINELNRNGTQVFNPFRPGERVVWWDVSGDGFVSPLDALLVINHLNVYGSGPLPPLPSRNFAPIGYSMDIALPVGASAVTFRPAILDLEGELLALSINVAPLHGTLVQIADSDLFTYTPAEGYVGDDVLEILATDQSGLSGLSPVRIMVLGTDPVDNGSTTNAADDVVDVEKNVQVTFNVVFNDTSLSTLEIVSFTQPQHGLLELDPGGSLIYTPHIDFVGEDTCTYTVQDATGVSASAQIVFRVA